MDIATRRILDGRQRKHRIGGYCYCALTLSTWHVVEAVMTLENVSWLTVSKFVVLNIAAFS